MKHEVKCKKGRWYLLLLVPVAAIVLWVAVRGIFYLSVPNTSLPQLSVLTENGAKITSKEQYVSCTVRLDADTAEYCGEWDASIRGRGNTTWEYFDKKPYRLKFDSKVSLFGEAANKSWVLLAMHNDHSLLKDRLGLAMAESLHSDAYVPCAHYVELTLNGTYQGVYLLTEQINEKKGRVDIEANIHPQQGAIPFLVELDYYAREEGVEGEDWFEVSTFSYSVHYPKKEERYSSEQFDYIKDYISTVDALCRTENVSIEQLSQYVDVAQMIDYYLVQEVMGQPEINNKSVYMSKTADGKLKMGPVWDFDWALMGPSTGKYRHRYADAVEGYRSVNNWFAALMNGSPAFREAVALRWEQVRGGFADTLTQMENEKEYLALGAQKNALRWYFFYPFYDYSDDYDAAISWCRARIAWLDSELRAYKD